MDPHTPDVAPAVNPSPEAPPQTAPEVATESAAARPDVAPTHLSREQILRVTAECLIEKGYDATTIRQIASMLRCAVGSIYRYFPDKRTLLSAVTQQILDPVAELVAPEDGQTPREGDFAQSVTLYIQRAAAAPEVYRLMFWLASVGRCNTTEQPLPDVIGRILAGWDRLLGCSEQSRRYWALVHGGLMLGLDEQRVIPFVKAAVAADKGLTRANPTASPQPELSADSQA